MTSPLTILPLGGLGEIGMNGLLVGWRGKRWLIDCGIMFPNDAEASTELVLPDLEFIRRIAPELAGIVLTHGHEDHIGAVAPVLNVKAMPVYGSPFTLGLVKRKLAERGYTGRVDFRDLQPSTGTVRPPETPELTFRFLRVTHSLPDCASLVIGTPHGNVLHTGDFKIDAEPMDGEHFDRAGFQALGDQGVLLLLSDSTNAQVPGRTRSERAVVETLRERVGAWPGRVLISLFASNLHRLRGLAEIAKTTNRRLVVAGRSFHSYLATARDAGIPSLDPSQYTAIDDLQDASGDDLLVAVTGSQGEPRGALWRAATGEHPSLRIGPRDLVMLSSRIIPGNERGIFEMVNHLSRRGATVVQPFAAPIHTSGHARQDELREMLALVRPKCFVPVHGEYAFLVDHAKLGREAGIKHIRVIENGDEVGIDPTDGILPLRNVPLTTFYLDGTITGDAETVGLPQRQKLHHNGLVAAHVRLKRSTQRVRATVELQSRGIFTEDGKLLDSAADELADTLGARRPAPTDADVEDIAYEVVRRVFRRATGKKPTVVTFVVTEPGAV